jgi:hypothetical protein
MGKLPFLLWPSGRSAKFDGPTSFEVASDGLAEAGSERPGMCRNRPHILPVQGLGPGVCGRTTFLLGREVEPAVQGVKIDT